MPTLFRPTESTIRFRNRLELLYPINRPNLSDDGTIHVFTDWGWFLPVSDPGERFANRQSAAAPWLELRGDQIVRGWDSRNLGSLIRLHSSADSPFTCP